MQILVLCDDRWHPARVPRGGLEPLTARGFEFDWIENAAEFKPEILTRYPLTILTKSDNVSSTDESGWMTGEFQSAFTAYVQQGGGLLAVHSGLSGWQEKPVLRGLLGGVFVQHPPQCPVTVEPKADHPLTAGCQAFTLQDEHYHMAFDANDAEIFLTTTSEHGSQPGGWRRSEGDGRVAVLTPGHNLEVWLHPSFQALLWNAMNWCGKISGD